MIKILFIFLIFLSSCSGSNFSAQNGNEQASEGSSEQILNSIVEGSTVDPDSLVEACSSSENITKVARSLSYVSRRNCSFGVLPNLETRDAYVQAYEVSEGTIAIPEGAVICNLSLQSQPDAQIHYDDFLFLTIENQVIFGSNEQVTQKLPLKDGIYQWDWSQIAGTAIDFFEADYYCLGSQDTCQLPPHDRSGAIDLTTNSKDIAPLAIAVAGKPQLQANLIATGDNDDEDCMHTDLQLTVIIDYISAE